LISSNWPITAVGGGVGVDVFLPQQLQRYALATQFPVNNRPVRQDSLGGYSASHRRQKCLVGRLIQNRSGLRIQAGLAGALLRIPAERDRFSPVRF